MLADPLADLSDLLSSPVANQKIRKLPCWPDGYKGDFNFEWPTKKVPGNVKLRAIELKMTDNKLSYVRCIYTNNTYSPGFEKEGV